ncbi:MAG TPA: AsmA family protein [Candidatus Angelobacter sp.]|nr:AsmA family protein [Candidatus Angelobacter sp.]
MKRLLIIAGIVLGVLVVAVVMAPLFIDADSFRPDLEKKLSDSLGRTVHVGKLDASILSGGAKASNISISDDPAFSKGPFLQASSVQIGLELIPLIFSHQVKVTSLSVQSPDIVLLKNSAGKWNFSNLGAAAGKGKGRAASGNSSVPESSMAISTASVFGDAQSKNSGSSAPELSVDKFEIVNGTLRVGQSAGHTASHESVYKNVRLLARNISETTVIPFTLLADTPGGGSLDVDGTAGPLNAEDSARTPMDAKLTLEHADLARSGFFDANSGLAGIVDFDGKVKSDGRKLHSEGRAKANNLKMMKGGAPSSQPVSLDYKSDFGLESQTGTLSAQAHTGGSTATVSGTMDAHGEKTLAHLKILAQKMAVNDIEGILPAFGVTLPSGASLQGGTINADLAAEGPLDRLVITGPVKLSDTKLTGYDLSSKLGAVAALAGIRPSSETLIQTLSSALHVSPEGINADNILLDVPSLGQITGAGVMGSNSSLNFKMLMKPAGAMAQMAGGLGALAGNKGIPFLIEGTTANPIFRPALGSTIKSLIPGANDSGNQGGLGGVLGGLFGKKKK